MHLFTSISHIYNKFPNTVTALHQRKHFVSTSNYTICFCITGKYSTYKLGFRLHDLHFPV